ncbi:hypothetical protein [Rhizobium paknamense]|uniref:Uncharacterized protein n=1 Tax=Rhizobium paknamense TaxID=1206817 RepID=A0ABU0IJ36_9HYPH|nr:hypothetical protein [Rhizobium paknamense]MDQ0457251.1 hypothetical protein [Rhizobium paknamense]
MAETEARQLADEYLRRGGQRKVKIDDNITDVREWDDEPPEAERFWKDNIAPLADKKRREIELLLPTINAR